MVNYIPTSWTQPELQDFFNQFGTVEDCKVVLDKATQTSKGYGFVKFATRAEAEICLHQAQGMQVESKRLKVQKAELGKGPPGNATVYVSGFDPITFSEQELIGYFMPYGSVVKVNMHTPQPGKKGVAFVTFEYYAEANLAMEALNGTVVGANGKDTLTVRISEQTSRAAHMHMAGAVPRQAVPMQAQGKMTGRVTMAPTQRYQPYKRPGQGGPMVAGLQQGMPRRMKNEVAVVPTPNGVDGNYCLFCYGLQEMDENMLWALFSPFGTIAHVKAPQGKNFGFVNMPNYLEAVNAINNLNGSTIHGASLPLQVSFKKDQQQQQ